MYKFCIDFYKNLLDKNSVSNAWENAKYSTEEMLKCKGDELNIKYFHYGMEPGPVLLPDNADLHSMSIFCNLKDGEYINTSPKRAQCDIEKDRRPFVGRQIELYKIAHELCEGNYVNLYGDYGVGKTRLAREIGYFLYVRLLFKSDIWYIESLSKGKSFKSVLESRLQYSQYDAQNMSILIILDNMTPDLWQCERHYFNSLKNARNFVFLFVSRDPLEPRETAEFPMFLWELRPFRDKEISLDFIFAMLEQVKSYPKAAALGVEEHNRKALRTAMAETRGFRQANGYPKLLLILYEKIVESNDVAGIDMVNDHTIGPRYRKIMRSIDKNSVGKGLVQVKSVVRKESVCIPEETDEFSADKILHEEIKRGPGRSLSIVPYKDGAVIESANKNDSKENEDINSSLGKELNESDYFEKPKNNDYAESNKSNNFTGKLNECYEEDSKEKTAEEKPEGKVSNQGSMRCESDESEDSSSESMGNISNVNHDRLESGYYDRDEEGEAILNMLNPEPPRLSPSATFSGRKKPQDAKKKKQMQSERKTQRRRVNVERRVKNEGEKEKVQKKKLGKTGKNAKKFKKATNNKYYKHKEMHKEPEKEDSPKEADAPPSDVSSESEYESPK
eukprot:TRINITY_DN6460_c0_g4_i2.p1 TRINITY_DN6460_c0_g4~~TRINITY_DN6460_c0_g4_i2.p1  ORF type:complete len:618 (-),score=196.68 TRINITY_DN6460_c0_g4_i2:118-1971(-)